MARNVNPGPRLWDWAVQGRAQRLEWVSGEVSTAAMPWVRL